MLTPRGPDLPPPRAPSPQIASCARLRCRLLAPLIKRSASCESKSHPCRSSNSAGPRWKALTVSMLPCRGRADGAGKRPTRSTRAWLLDKPNRFASRGGSLLDAAVTYVEIATGAAAMQPLTREGLQTEVAIEGALAKCSGNVSTQPVAFQHWVRNPTDAALVLARADPHLTGTDRDVQRVL